MSDFAKKLVAGTLPEVPAKTSWWPRHVRASSRYLLLAGSDMANALESARQSIIVGCVEWEQVIPSASRKGLMGHHAALEMGLVDAARSNDVEKIDRIGSLLYENAAEMAGSFGKTIVEFPEEAFRKILEGHVATFAESVRIKMEGHKSKVKCMDANTLALAAFSAEWF